MLNPEFNIRHIVNHKIFLNFLILILLYKHCILKNSLTLKRLNIIINNWKNYFTEKKSKLCPNINNHSNKSYSSWRFAFIFQTKFLIKEECNSKDFSNDIWVVLPLCKRSKQKLFFKTWKNIPRNSISHHWSVENASYELVITQLSNYNFNIMFLFYWHVSEETWRSDNRMISYHSDYNAADTIGVDVYGLSLSG